MSHPLQVRLGAIRRQARRMLLAYGLSWVFASVVASILLLGLADYVVHFQDPGIRAISTAAAAAVLVSACYRRLYGPLARRLRDLDVARRVEERFGFLGDQLSSSIEFLGQSEDDPQAGSAALRRAVVASTTAQVESLDFSQALDRRPARRAVATAAGIGLVAALAVALDPAGARLALARLVNPLGSAAWPRHNNLAFRNAPPKIASGQTFEVELFDKLGRPLPDSARIFYRYQDGNQTSDDAETIQLVGGALVARKDSVTRPFEYRAEGGDDRSMPWSRLEVVETPRVESLKIKVHPPEYTGWPVQPADRNIRAVRGTKVEVVATTTRPVTEATLVQEHGPAVPAKLAADCYSFRLPVDREPSLAIDKSGAYWFKLRDAQGLDGGTADRWEITAIADEPPSVSFERPGGNVFVTPQAEVSLRVVAKDDLAVKEVTLHYSRSDRSDVERFSVPLFTGPERVVPASGTGGATAGGDLRVVEHVWQLAPLDLKPGTQLTFYAAASDYLPQEGKSVVRRLTVITARELEDRIAQRQALIMAELARALKMQQEARGQVTSLEIQLREVGTLAKQDVDHAQGAELNQRQVNRTLTSRGEGVPLQVADLLADLASNKVDHPDVERRMTSILSEIARLAREHLPAIERDLTTAIKSAQSKLARTDQPPLDRAPPDPVVAAALTGAGRHQDQVIQSLESMLGELTQWDGFRRFARDVEQLRRDQEDLQQKAKAAGAKTLAKDWKDLDPQQQADLKKLAARQLDLARRFDKLQQQMQDAQGRLAGDDPLAAASLGDALDVARKQSISGQMRQSSSQLEQNQTGQAGRQHEQIGQALAEMVDILANRRQQELSRLVKKLRETEQQLAGIRRQQAGLRKKAAAAAKLPNEAERKQELQRLAREQRQLEQDAQRLARQLKRLQADRAGQTLAGAGSKMGKSGEAGEQGDAAGADQQAAGAQSDLEEAQQQLAERRRQAEADLATEQLARLEDALKNLRDCQDQAIKESRRLEGLRDKDGQLTRAQAASVRDLAQQQRAVEADTRLQGENLSTAEVFRLALDAAAEDAHRAVELLDGRTTDAPTQDAQASALARFDQVLAALKAGAAAAKPPGGEGAGGEGAGGSGQKSLQEQIRALSEVRLLKLMQEALNQRFSEASDPAAKLSDAERTGQLERLSREQGKLAEAALNLSEPAEPPPESNPDKLPDVREPNSPDDGPPLDSKE